MGDVPETAAGQLERGAAGHRARSPSFVLNPSVPRALLMEAYGMDGGSTPHHCL